MSLERLGLTVLVWELRRAAFAYDITWSRVQPICLSDPGRLSYKSDPFGKSGTGGLARYNIAPVALTLFAAIP
jgi:hypothetical protein